MSRIWSEMIAATMAKNSQLLVIPANMFSCITLKDYLIVKLAAIQEVEHLHHDERIEHDCEVTGIDVIGCPYIDVVVPSAY